MSDDDDGTNKGKSIKGFFNATLTGKQSSKSLGMITARDLLKASLDKGICAAITACANEKITDHKPAFKDFVTAVHLVGLVQVSSASVERLFSQLKIVVNSVGQSMMLEETLEARLFVLENMIPNGVYLS
jgi:hypothetical protein